MLQLFLLSLLIDPSFGQLGLSSCPPCGLAPCHSRPACCPNGQFVPDHLCGCCPVCAVDEGGECGGAFNSLGKCGKGLICYRGCGCKTERGSKCVFPYKYEDVTYHTCTVVNSTNGQPWCALEVDEDGQVISGRWDDCHKCNDPEELCGVQNFKGICVSDRDRKRIEGTFFGNESLANPVFTFDRQVRTHPAPACTPTLGPGKCRCAFSDTLGSGARASEAQPPCRSPIKSLLGWCFLEHVQSPESGDVLKDCYKDAQWSPAHGRYYSYLACQDFMEHQLRPDRDHHEEN